MSNFNNKQEGFLGKRLSIQTPKAYNIRNSKNVFFDDILVIINFNQPFYKNIGFIKEIYKEIPNIVFYGPTKSPENNDVICCEEIKDWTVAYMAVVDAIKRFPSYHGYLFVMDDMLLNFWNLTKRDKNKVWFKDIDMYLAIDTSCETIKFPWPWWQQKCGLGACINALHELVPRFRNRLEENLGNKNTYIHEMSDCFYLPRRLGEDFINVFTVFYKFGVLLEIAVPMGLCAIENHTNWEILDLKYLWGAKKVAPLISNTGARLLWRRAHSYDADGFHPVKFSSKLNQKTIRFLFGIQNSKKLSLYFYLSIFLEILIDIVLSLLNIIKISVYTSYEFYKRIVARYINKSL